MKVSSNVVGNSNDQNNFPHKLLLTNTKISKLCIAFEYGLSANIKLSKTQLHKKVKSEGFLGRLLRPIIETGLPLMKNVLKLLAKSVLIPLQLTTAASATDATIHKKISGSGHTTLMISNEELNNIMKIVKSLEGSGLLIKGVSETVRNQAK